MLLVVGKECQPITVGRTGDHEVRIQNLLFLVIYHGITVELEHGPPGLFDHGLCRRGVPF